MEQQPHQLEYATTKPPSVLLRVLNHLALAALLVGIVFHVWLLQDLFRPPRPLSSSTRLRIIASDAIGYAVDYREFPDSFETLVQSKWSPPVELFASPKGPATPAPDYKTLFAEPGHISYVWIGSGLNWDNVKPDTPIAYEGPVTDFEAGALVAFVDGSVRKFKGNELRTLLSEAEKPLQRATTSPATQPATTRASSQPALDTARKELEAVFAERVRATRAKDADALVAMISPDYEAILPDGRRVGHEEIIAYLRRGTEQFIEVKEMTVTIERLELRGVGGDAAVEAVVDARQRVARTQRLADGQVHDVFATVLQAETWVRTPDGWKLRLVTDLREQQFLVDGQPVEQGR